MKIITRKTAYIYIYGLEINRWRLTDQIIVAVCYFSRLVLSDSFAIPETLAHQAHLPKDFPRQEHWSGLAISFSRGISWPRDGTYISCIGKWILYHWATRKAQPTKYINLKIQRIQKQGQLLLDYNLDNNLRSYIN